MWQTTNNVSNCPLTKLEGGLQCAGKSLVTNFIKIDRGVFELQGSENRGLPLTWLIILTTVQHYCADCDDVAVKWLMSWLSS